MDQKLDRVRDYVDENGNPAGGSYYGRGINIDWQDGPLGTTVLDSEGLPHRLPESPNGAFVEGVINAAIHRLNFYQRSKFACADNEAAIKYLAEAKECLNRRTGEREARGVEGTHAV